MHEEAYYAERALKAGAMGYIMKQEARKDLITAIHRILSGRLYFTDRCTNVLFGKLRGRDFCSEYSTINTLSDRELQVFRLIGQGDGTKEIAQKLHLSISTIDTYYSHMKRKLGLKDNNQLRHYAIEFMRKWTE